MSVTETIMSPGQWSLSLLPETPPSLRNLLLYGFRGTQGKGIMFASIIITPTPINLDSGDAAILAAARYSGRLIKVADARGESVNLSGDGLFAWLGDDSGAGDMLEEAVTIAGLNFEDSVAAVLNGIVKIDFNADGTLAGTTAIDTGLTIGTFTEPPHPAGLYRNQEVGYTPRAAIERICQWFSGFVITEVRVNQDGTIDGGPIYDLYPTNPKYPVYDSFRRALNLSSLGTSDSGHVWTADVGTWGIVDVASEDGVDGVHAQLTSATAVAVASVDTTLTDYIYHVGIRTSPANAGTDVGIVFRLQDATNFLTVWVGGGLDRRITLQKVVAGVYTDLSQSATNQWVPGTTILLSVHCNYDYIRVFLNGDELLTATLSSADYAQFGDETHVGLWTDGPDDDGEAYFTFIAVDDLTQRPTVVATRKEGGHDPNIIGVRTRGLGTELDVSEYVTRSAVLLQDGPLVLPSGIAQYPIPTPYRNFAGDPVNIVSATDAAGFNVNGDPAADMAAAQNAVELAGKPRRHASITAAEYDLTGYPAGAGHAIYVFDKIRGLYDPANQLKHRGEWIYPIILRVESVTWPIVQGMGVYLRYFIPGDTTPTYLSLSRWMQWEQMEGGITPSPRAQTAFDLTRAYENIIATSRVGDYPGDILGPQVTP